MPEAFFLSREPDGRGQRHCILHRPQGAARPRGAMVYVHPWCEEMNKARRMAAMQSRALAGRGWAVLQVDLLGCGDSGGDFGDATWADWVDDVVAASRWLAANHPGPQWLWGLRAGCLLACEAAGRIDDLAGLLFWQPAASGRNLLQQFLMLGQAGQLQGGNAKGVMQALRDELAQGRAVEVAGYTMSAALADGLAAATLQAPAPGTAALWFEISTKPQASASPVLAQAQQRWADAGVPVTLSVVPGPAFWQTTEIEDAPALVDATLSGLAAMPA